ncbi:MAG: group III truncated hemoglobin [Sphingobacteriales bacterium]|nr:MAG: group III truncated hemoglobin [Sphingobacteriales bacterium]
MKELEDIDDIKTLVNTFYDKVNRDEILSPVFNDVAKVDWPKHLPTMYKFWEMLLLDGENYKGNPFQKHIPLPISPAHFQRWIKLFLQTVDELFLGEKAEMARSKAKSIAQIFEIRMKQMGNLVSDQ